VYKKIFKNRWVQVAIVITISFLIGYMGGKSSVDNKKAMESAIQTAKEHEGHGHSSEELIDFWTCSMHPQIKMPTKGKCPICGMDLIPVKKGGSGEEGPREIKISKNAMALAELVTSPVERKFVSVNVDLVGKVEYDETRLKNITSWVPGRLDRLYVDYTGVPVKKGDHLVWIYSPDLISAQVEYLLALRNLKAQKGGNLGEMYRRTFKASEEKLRLLGITDEQLKQIRNTGKPMDHITISAPIGGIVIHKNAVEGMYVETGTKIYTIVDLSRIWVIMDAYESDITWIRYGQEVRFSVEAYPGETFKGSISFIDPVLDEKTRTIKVRLNVENERGKLKPGMFVKAVVKSSVAASGKVMDPVLAGKWIGPMHPEIVMDHPGKCSICGMPLVKAETLGYVETAKADKAPLVIPASAPLITGKRAVVYVEKAIEDNAHIYEGREVVLGPRAGNYYLVKEGLSEGETVVVNGNFKIDSALQILAKPSMMSPEKKEKEHTDKKEAVKTEKLPVSVKFLTALQPLYKQYEKAVEALSVDDFLTAKKALEGFPNIVDKIDMVLLSGAAHMEWMKTIPYLSGIGEDAAKTSDIQELRNVFSNASRLVINVVKRFGHSEEETLNQAFCPMAFDNKGAYWLQVGEDIRNPYFGKAMYRCGEVKETFEPY
jgi:Cu(I)/Ag(I) efflux system membrane fusion protein